MSEIEINLPTVTYGNVKVRATPEELGMKLSEPHDIGIATAVFLNLFTAGFRVGAKMDVIAPVSASQEAPEEKAKELLGEGLGGVTELSEGMSERAEQDAADMRARHQAEAEAAGKAPWNKAPAAGVKKPWETGETATKAVSEDW